MNKLMIWVVLAHVTCPAVIAVYFTGLKEVFQPPTKLLKDAYFGYSITYDQANAKLIISAPRTDNVGDVYDCNISNRVCKTIDRSKIQHESQNYTHEYWFGATVKSGPDFVMMCAPRYTQYYTRFGRFVTFGKCFSYEKGKLIERRTIPEKNRIEDSPSPLEATMDSFGWSIDVGSDDSVIVGGPGMFHGRAMIYKPPLNKPPIFIRKTKHTPEFNFGYAVAVGAFLKKDMLMYAIGSPYGTSGIGRVGFYQDLSFSRDLNKKVDTKVVGSMFGAVLCAASLAGKKSDLLVGAPTYASTKDTYNEGAVYVYLAQITDFKSPEFKRKIVGRQSGALFGSAIISVGDLNGDKKPEIAISAPFEDNGRGVVYLYSAADLISEKTEKTLIWLQRIVPEPSYANSFGMSLTSLLDYDQNGCRELAIGSPYTDRVLLLRCMASVTIRTSAIFPNLQSRTSTGRTNFTFQVCLTVQYPPLPKTITAHLSTTVEMNHGYAKVNTTGLNMFTFETKLDLKQPQYCTNVPLYLPLNGNYETEIRYQISTKLLNDPRYLPNFDSSRVILSDLSVLTLQDSLWAAECKGRICEPKLSLTHKISINSANRKYVIGSTTTESIDISVSNSGEVAYDSCVRVHIVGMHVFVHEHPAACVREVSTDGDRLVCAPTRPLKTNENWATDKIILEMTHLTNVDNNVTINLALHTRCKDPPAQKKSIPVLLIADPSGIVGKGENDIGPIVNMTNDDIRYNGKKMQHVYTIRNNGLTNWVDLSVNVTLEKKDYIEYDDTPVTLYFYIENTYFDCPAILNDEKSMVFFCNIDSLPAKKQFAKILIPMYIKPESLDGILNEDNNVTITSSINIQYMVGGYKSESIITTMVFLQDPPVELWIIITAVAVGLLILIIIAFILYRVGFLRRQKKEELKRLQKSVKRQTILRRSTMPTQGQQRQSNEDRRQILEGLNDDGEDVLLKS